MNFAGHYIIALLVVALMLFGLYTIVRAIGRNHVMNSADKRIVTVVESTPLAQNTALHVVKVADRYYLVGGGSGHVSTLAEVPSDQADSFVEQLRRGRS